MSEHYSLKFQLTFYGLFKFYLHSGETVENPWMAQHIEQPLDGVHMKTKRDIAKFHQDYWKYQTFQLPTPENSDSYFRLLASGSKECFVDGTDWGQVTNTSEICVCRDNYFGPDCGIPEAPWYGYFKNHP